MQNAIIIKRNQKDKEIIKVIQSRNKKGSQLLDRYLTLINKLGIVIPNNMMVL